MKSRTMKVLTPLMAFALTLGLEAGTSLASVGFEAAEGYTAGEGIPAGMNFVFVPPTEDQTVTDQSKVMAYEETSAAGGANYLKLSTEDGKLFRQLDAAVPLSTDGVEVDAMMQFTATDSADRPAAGDEKFVLWLDARTEGENTEYKLMAWGGKYTIAAEGGAISLVGSAMYELSGVDIEPGQWANVKVKAYSTVNGTGTAIPGFQVLINDTPLTVARYTPPQGEGNIFDADGFTIFDVDNSVVASGIADGTYLPSMSTNATLQAVGFAGEGKVDNLAITDNYVVPTVSFGITVPAGAEIVSVSNKTSGAILEADAETGKYTADPNAPLAVVIGLPTGKLFADGSKTKTVDVTAATGTVDATPAEAVVNSVATIGDTEYVSLAAAVTAIGNGTAPDGSTIKLVGEGTTITEAGLEVTAISGKTYTLDLNGKTYAPTGKFGFWPGCTVTLTNGTVSTASAQKYLLVSYASKLTIVDVTFDGTNLTKADEKTGIRCTNGSLEIKGNTQFINWPTGASTYGTYAIAFGDYASASYSMDTLTIDSDVTLTGDILIAGGTVEYKKGAFAGHVQVGARRQGFATAETVVGSGFAAYIGTYPTEKTASDYEINVTGELYPTLDAAITAATAGDTVQVVSDTSVAGQIMLTKNLTLTNAASTVTFADLTGSGDYNFYVDGATLTLEGEGTWQKPASTGGGSMFTLGRTAAATVIINNGTYIGATPESTASDKGPSNLFQAKNAAITINGGTFVNYRKDEGRCVRSDGANSVITVNGGTFECSADKVGANTSSGRLNPIDRQSGTITIPATSTAKVKAHPDNVAVMSTYSADSSKVFVAAADGWYELGTAVASIGNVKYASLPDAVAAAANGATVTVCADVTLDAALVISKTITLDATGYTVAGAKGVYAIQIMDGALTIVDGTFKAEDTTSNSLFLIGDWEGKTEDQYKSGTLTVQGGTFSGAKVGNLIKNSRGDIVITGGTFNNTTGSRGIKADGPAATVTINGGTINCTGKKALCADQGGTITVNAGTLSGNVVIEGSDAASTITINGGTVSGTLSKTSGTILIPGTSTALFNADQSAFCASGYKTVADAEHAGFYKVVEAPTEIALEPGATTTEPFASQAAAEAAMGNVVITPAAAVSSELTAEQLTTYTGKFTKKVVPAADGKFAVAVVLSDDAETALQAQANADAAECLKATVSIATTPGFYYSIKEGTTLTNMVEGDRKLATGDTLTFEPSKSATSGFYKVIINLEPKKAAE